MLVEVGVETVPVDYKTREICLNWIGNITVRHQGFVRKLTKILK